MLDKDDAGRLLEYSVWANHRIVRAAATLGLDDFKRDLGASYGGVRGTLCHIMGAEWIWLERWKGVSPARLIDEGEFADVVALRDRWTVIEEHRESWLQSLRAEALTGTIRYRNLAGAEYEGPLWQLVQHVANHSTYHRGQVVMMLRLLGAKTVSTDIVLWDREREAKALRNEAG
jgi:uncharacterized damage-inducible protein DinB